ncbi:MAG: 50S ribosomal protein L11 methyltransferase [Abitibacteriaceae bacterium]|nr:50S ribosomal protein L11 methyltransferase [Abditibacteriaceae bacterium]MBV9864091.1 50S ribosomal protein L11 methyltransferase [Abditibacteriaceae bacterium]
MADWIQLRLVAPPEEADVCAQLLLDAGCSGVQIDDCAVLFDQSEDATIISKPEAFIIGYLTDVSQLEPAQKLLNEALQQGHLTARLETDTVPTQDWSTSWRENFPPLHIGSFLIVPSWEESVAETDTSGDGQSADADIVIQLDPGLAFGTGQHPTTRLCLELLSQYLAPVASQSRNSPALLDVGCGSGILSIAAAKLGATVTASDLDAFCVQATHDNALANQAAVQVVQAAGLDWTTTQFDFVLANLMSALLITLAPALSRVTRDDGTLIVSGISEPRALEVEAALQAVGFNTLERRDLDGEQRGDFTERWSAFVMQKAK